ncbi:MAG: hypothetical protein Q8P67_17880 [archaeon]|nr:hypothetical protein [archaeon]
MSSDSSGRPPSFLASSSSASSLALLVRQTGNRYVDMVFHVAGVSVEMTASSQLTPEEGKLKIIAAAQLRLGVPSSGAAASTTPPPPSPSTASSTSQDGKTWNSSFAPSKLASEQKPLEAQPFRRGLGIGERRRPTLKLGSNGSTSSPATQQSSGSASPLPSLPSSPLDYRELPLSDSADMYCWRFVGPTVQPIITNERAPLRRNQIVQICSNLYCKPLIELVPIDCVMQEAGMEGGGGQLDSVAKRRQRTAVMFQAGDQTSNFFSSGAYSSLDLAADATLHDTLGKMIAGDDYKKFLECYLPPDDLDVVFSRKYLAQWRIREILARRKQLSSMITAEPNTALLPAFIGGEPSPKAVPQELWFSFDVVITAQFSKHLNPLLIFPDASVDDLLEAAHNHAVAESNASPSPSLSEFVQLPRSQLVMKVPKVCEFLVNELGAAEARPLLRFDHIRRCISNGGGTLSNPILLTLMPISVLDSELLAPTQQLQDPDSAVDQLIAREDALQRARSLSERLDAERQSFLSRHLVVPHHTYTQPFCLRVGQIDNVIVTVPDVSFYVMAELFHGGRRLCAPAFSHPIVPPAAVFTSESPLRPQTSMADMSGNKVTLLAILQDPQQSSDASSSMGRRGKRSKHQSVLQRRVLKIQVNQWLLFKGFNFCDIPPGTRLCVTVFQKRARVDESKLPQLEISDVPLGWMARQVINPLSIFRHGEETCHLWPNERANPIGTCADNRRNLATFRSLLPLLSESDTPSSEASEVYTSNDLITLNEQQSQIHPPLVLTVEYNSSPIIVFTHNVAVLNTFAELSPSPFEIKHNKHALRSILRKDPLAPLAMVERKMLWQYRHYFSRKPSALARFMRAIAWNNPWQVAEAHRMLELWRPPQPLVAIELLGHRYSDPKVRSYAVAQLENLSDPEVNEIILQLTQCLKHESTHHSALALFLLVRAKRSAQIGQSLFWMLKVELDQPDIAERFTILLEAYLRFAGPKMRELIKQASVLTQLLTVARNLKATPPAERKEFLRQHLSGLQFPPRFELPLDLRWQCSGLQVDQCKFMDSKMVPLWLVFSNFKPSDSPLTVMLKVGDDLRQDALTLQVIRLMDRLWKTEGLDLRLKPYGCVATGNMTGLIEVVLNSNTCAKINAATASTSMGGAKAIFSANILTEWLRQSNPTEDEFQRAQETFKRSCAGYCVATYVLGIGDRHNDNIMMSKAGHFFHIDFGHFLGHFKSKFGVERERAPFIFTKQMAHILGGRGSPVYRSFVSLCCQAYNILRKNGNLLMNLFLLMIQAGIPELSSINNIHHLRRKLKLHLDDDGAAELFAKKIEKSRRTLFTLIDHSIHILAH